MTESEQAREVSDRLELQARGLLLETRNSDWIVNLEWCPDTHTRYRHRISGHIAQCEDRSKLDHRVWRRAHPKELVAHGIIDELVADEPSECCGAEIVDGECSFCGDGVNTDRRSCISCGGGCDMSELVDGVCVWCVREGLEDT